MTAPHWSDNPRARWLYEHEPEYRRHFDQLDGKIPADPDPTPEEIALVNTCAHRECREGCLMSSCKLGKGPKWRKGQVAILDCVKCLRESV